MTINDRINANRLPKPKEEYIRAKRRVRKSQKSNRQRKEK